MVPQTESALSKHDSDFSFKNSSGSYTKDWGLWKCLCNYHALYLVVSCNKPHMCSVASSIYTQRMWPHLSVTKQEQLFLTSTHQLVGSDQNGLLMSSLQPLWPRANFSIGHGRAEFRACNSFRAHENDFISFKIRKKSKSKECLIYLSVYQCSCKI